MKHVHDKVFAPNNGMRRNVPKVVVAITDGRSQDEVKKNAAKLQHSGKPRPHRPVQSNAPVPPVSLQEMTWLG